ncbi:alpha/beta hydrolase [Kitasatospora sp. NPDC004240]
MRSFRAARPRVLLTALAAGTLLFATSCENGDRPAAQDRAASTTGTTGTTATPTPTAKPTGADDPALKSFYGQQIAWAACPADPKAKNVDLSATQCGKLHVPLDYANPTADALDIALIKLPATKPDQRVGSLMINPGGPGGSGVEMLKNDIDGFGALHDRFDIIGFDPRGTGASSPVVCYDDKQRDAHAQTDDPADPQVRKAQQEKNTAEYVAACQAKSGRLLPFVGTRNAARDLDVLRGAVGDKKLHYLGVSYGTYLGSVYAEEFPGNVGRLVLDAAVNPTDDGLAHSIDQQIGFEKSFGRFAVDCVRNHPTECPLGTDPDSAAKKAADYLDSLREKPLTTKDGRKLGRDLAWTGALSLLYGDEKTAWKYLRAALGWAMVRDKGDMLLAFADAYNGRDETGHYDPSQPAFTAIRCADGATPAPTPERAQAAVTRLKAEAPLFSRDVSADDFTRAQCADWPYKTPEKPRVIRAEGAAPILVVGTTGDPATPYASAEALAKGFASATLLTLVGEGHGAFGKDNTCIDRALEGYLIEGTMPAAGTRCS